MYAAQHETHVSKVLEQIADCLRDNVDKTLRDCLEPKVSLNQNSQQNGSQNG